MEIQEYKLPDLDDFRTISPEQIEKFREDGHTITKGLLSPEEVAAYHSVVTNAALKYNTERRKIEDRDTYGKAFLQIMNLWRHDEKVKKLVMSRRLAKAAADLLGVENVRIYHDQALLKNLVVVLRHGTRINTTGPLRLLKPLPCGCLW